MYNVVKKVIQIILECLSGRVCHQLSHGGDRSLTRYVILLSFIVGFYSSDLFLCKMYKSNHRGQGGDKEVRTKKPNKAGCQQLAKKVTYCLRVEKSSLYKRCLQCLRLTLHKN